MAKKFWQIVSAILLVLVLVLGLLWWRSGQVNSPSSSNSAAVIAPAKIKIISFLDLFINQVLRSESEISFETRLKLENAVRDLGDQEILNRWQQFVESTNEREAQTQVKELLSLLVAKINQ